MGNDSIFDATTIAELVAGLNTKYKLALPLEMPVKSVLEAIWGLNISFEPVTQKDVLIVAKATSEFSFGIGVTGKFFVRIEEIRS